MARCALRSTQKRQRHSERLARWQKILSMLLIISTMSGKQPQVAKSNHHKATKMQERARREVETKLAQHISANVSEAERMCLAARWRCMNFDFIVRLLDDYDDIGILAHDSTHDHRISFMTCFYNE